MPTKTLTDPAGFSGPRGHYRFGGGSELIYTVDGFLTGYTIDAAGGDDTVYGSNADDILVGGDGSDVLFGGEGEDILIGGHADPTDISLADPMALDSSKGQNPPPTNLLVGDGVKQGDLSILASIVVQTDVSVTGSDDQIYGGNGATNMVFADYDMVTLDAGSGAGTVTAYTGGDDTVTGGNSGADNTIYGDAEEVTFAANSTFEGGIDTIQGGVDSVNLIFGDIAGDPTTPGNPITGVTTLAAGAMFTGGDDVIQGGAGTGIFTADNEIYGDIGGTFTLTANTSLGAEEVNAQGGADTITGGDGAENEIYGDFNTVNLAEFTRAAGGDDVLTGGDADAYVNLNILYGDARTIYGTAGEFIGGDDILYGGLGATDYLYGDWITDSTSGSASTKGGADRFVFNLDGGDDIIFDLRSADNDVIDLSAFGFSTRGFNGGGSLYADLAMLMDDLIVDSGGTAMIDFGQDDDVLAGSGTILVMGWSETELQDAVGSSLFDFG